MLYYLFAFHHKILSSVDFNLCFFLCFLCNDHLAINNNYLSESLTELLSCCMHRSSFNCLSSHLVSDTVFLMVIGNSICLQCFISLGHSHACDVALLSCVYNLIFSMAAITRCYSAILTFFNRLLGQTTTMLECFTHTQIQNQPRLLHTQTLLAMDSDYMHLTHFSCIYIQTRAIPFY